MCKVTGYEIDNNYYTDCSVKHYQLYNISFAEIGQIIKNNTKNNDILKLCTKIYNTQNLINHYSFPMKKP